MWPDLDALVVLAGMACRAHASPACTGGWRHAFARCGHLGFEPKFECKEYAEWKKLVVVSRHCISSVLHK